MTKVCSRCKRELDLSSFTKDNRYAGGHQTWCRECKNEYKRDKWANDPEFRDRQRDLQRKSHYGLDVEAFSALLASQGDACAICGLCPIRAKWFVDHDHGCCPGKRSCGKCVRGILCQGCNLAAGAVRDSPGRAFALANYLMGWKYRPPEA